MLTTGDVTYLHVGGQSLVYLSGDAMFDLLDKRGSIYSDRPKLVMVGELCAIIFFLYVVKSPTLRNCRCGYGDMVMNIHRQRDNFVDLTRCI
jgi:hypothetical protein